MALDGSRRAERRLSCHNNGKGEEGEKTCAVCRGRPPRTAERGLPCSLLLPSLCILSFSRGKRQLPFGEQETILLDAARVPTCWETTTANGQRLGKEARRTCGQGNWPPRRCQDGVVDKESRGTETIYINAFGIVSVAILTF